MSLDVDVSRVKDKTKVRTPDGKWDPTAFAIAFYTTAIGMGEITEKNYEEFFRRIWTMQAVVGTSGGEFFTLEDIKGLIGLRTNVFPTESRRKFDSRAAKMALEHAVRARQATEKTQTRGTMTSAAPNSSND